MVPGVGAAPVSGPPVGTPPVPQLVLDEAAGRRVRAVWRNQIGGTTWQIGDGSGRDFLKLGPEHPEFDIPGELARLDWLRDFLPVPEVVSCGFSDDGVWLRTRGLPGENAVTERNTSRPAVVVPALARGLRRLHDQLPVEECPWEWSTAQRIAGLARPAEHEVPPVRPGDLVVCHGDACSPNFLVDEAGEVTGYVDLGRCGVGDRHADLAPALMSLGWNFGPGWADCFVDAYCAGTLRLDEDRLAFHTWLWNAE